MSPVWLVICVCGILLQVFVISLMTRGFYRKFPVVFAYLLILLLTTVADLAGAVDAQFWEDVYPNIYYLNDTLRHLSGFVAVGSLYFHATVTHPRRGPLRIQMLLGASAAILMTLALTPGNSLLTDGGDSSTYFIQVTRNLGFITALLNVALWVALVRSRSGGLLLLLVSGGLGVNMAGIAIAQSIWLLSPESDFAYTLVSAIGVGSHFLCLGIWLWALRLERRVATGESARRVSAGGR